MSYDASNDPEVFMARYKEIRAKFRPEPVRRVVINTPTVEKPTPVIVITKPTINPHPIFNVKDILDGMPINIPKAVIRIILDHYALEEAEVMTDFIGPLGERDPLKFVKKCVRWEIWTHLYDLGYSNPAIGKASSIRKFDHTSVLYGKRKMVGLIENKEWELWYGWRKQLYGLLSPSQSSTFRYAG
jgi:hypothetical protein